LACSWIGNGPIKLFQHSKWQFQITANNTITNDVILLKQPGENMIVELQMQRVSGGTKAKASSSRPKECKKSANAIFHVGYTGRAKWQE
jgi:hypothetical protein